ncbi:hypothetical protein jhhlp_004944 [Lomentospora prolificans]|uniref:Aminoglycoside N(3)-acetyltransferase n=1 Tax=Lomentospora prolificans TaxID=41688 RepID=A0A2N3N810_9PEZI|nr:hypothetical protein jhhlp_004944 [Lomentospora prolificans]
MATRIVEPVVSGPISTRSSFADDFRRLGLTSGDTVLVHSSLKALGWVCGGAEAVVLALLDVLSDKGTLVVPTFTAGNSDPSLWSKPPIPEEWWPIVRSHVPPFNIQTSSTWRMGLISEMVRTWPGTLRSAHPQTSFAALGPNAKAITDGHAWECRLGDQSPLARLEELNAKVLLLGVGYDNCTSFHLAQYRIAEMPREKESFAVITENGREWVTVDDTAVPDNGFENLGEDFEKARTVCRRKVAAADARLFSIVDAVSYALEWLPKHPPLSST